MGQVAVNGWVFREANYSRDTGGARETVEDAPRLMHLDQG